MNNSDHNMSFREDETTNFTQLFYRFLANWPWFIGSLLFFSIITFLYLRYTTPLYNIQAQIMINDAKKGAGSASPILADLGVPLSSSVENEAEVLKTRFLMEQVVEDMNLNVVYFKQHRFNYNEVYEAPFKVELRERADTIKPIAIDVEILDDGGLQLESEHGINRRISFDQAFQVKGVGVLVFKRNNQAYTPGDLYKVSITSIDNAVNKLRGALEISLVAKQVSIINLALTYAVPKKGEDILRRMMEIYVQTNVDDRNRIADSSYLFIQKRLSYLGGELGDLEGDIQAFKQKNRIAEMSEQSRIIIQNSSQFVNDLAKVETQINVLKSIKEYIESGENGNRVVPSSLMISDPLFNSLVENYNALLMDRERRLVGVTESNPVIVNIDSRINSLRNDMLSNINSTFRTLNITKTRIQEQMSTVQNQVQGVPQIERNYLELARQQQIKQELYVFLMKKGEETAIAKTYNTPNSKNIDPPKADPSPVSPKKVIYYAISFLLALLLPSLTVYGKFLLNTRIESKEDLTNATGVSVIGEIGHNSEVENLVVLKNSRSAIAEQFRALRTNLSFYLPTSEEKVVMFTSSMSGEGKSFLAINLGSILSLSNNRVLLMEMDLRKPGLSGKVEVANTVGISNYLADPSLLIDEIIRPVSYTDKLSIVTSGTIPPNPAELLMNPRMEELIDSLRSRFDYIIIDAPPIGIVTDAQLLSKYAHLCIYVVRQKYTLKAQLNILEQLRKDNKMKKLAVVVNDITPDKSYGYGYGYNHGYGNYGTESEIVSKRGFLKKVFTRRNS